MHPLIDQKIRNPDYAGMIRRNAAGFTPPEAALLDEILERFEFDVVQEQALVQAVMQQSRFDPNASHIAYEEDGDDETTLICPHCLNPPVPPLRDYYMWREGSRR